MNLDEINVLAQNKLININRCKLKLHKESVLNYEEEHKMTLYFL